MCRLCILSLRFLLLTLQKKKKRENFNANKAGEQRGTFFNARETLNNKHHTLYTQRFNDLNANSQ